MNKFTFFKKKKVSGEKPEEKKEPLIPSKIPVKKPEKKFKPGPLSRLSLHEKELFIKRLGYLLKAGVPILQSLAMVQEQTRSGLQKKIIDSLVESVKNGKALHIGLLSFRKIFGDFVINVVRIGEETGRLPQNLEYLAEELKKRRLLKRKIVSAFVYPAFIAFVTLIVTVFLIVFIFPKILPILSSLNVPLPFTTRALIWLSHFLGSYWFYVILAVIFLIIITSLLLRIKKVSLFINRIIPSVPVIGKLLQYYQIANVCRTLGVLLQSGVALIESLKITAETTPNPVYRQALERLEADVLTGKKISTQFRNFPRYFPVLIPQMLTIGEATGKLSESFFYLAEFYETELDEMTKNLSNVLEPILMIFMGVIVGTVVISIITPIYGITQHLNVR